MAKWQQHSIAFIRQRFGNPDFVPLHAPQFWGQEKVYLLDAIDSTFMSSVRAYLKHYI